MHRLRRVLFSAALAGITACQGGGPALPPAPNPPPDQVVRGGRLFLDPRVSGDTSRSCASCHPGGRSDGKVWLEREQVPAGTERGRNTPSLRGTWQTPPWLWDGSAATLDAAIARMLAVEMRGGSLPPADARALRAYLESLAAFDRGTVEPDGSPREPAMLRTRRGYEVFRDRGCAKCHAPPSYARPRLVVPTVPGIDPPSLRGLSSSAPYGHDGRWPSVELAVRAHAADLNLSERELYDLLSYLSLL